MKQWIRRGRFLLVCGLLASAIGCTKDPAREGENWSRLKANAAEYTTAWPKFKTIVDARLTEGEKALEATKSIADKAKQGEAMSEAIDAYGKIVNKLGEVKFKSQGIDDLIAKLNKIKLPKDKSKRRNQVVSEAREKMLAVTTKLEQAVPTNEAEALAAIDPAIGELISIRGSVDRAISSFKKK